MQQIQVYLCFLWEKRLVHFQIVNESLRVYPVTFIERLCVKDYKVPDLDFVIPKGMIVQIAR